MRPPIGKLGGNLADGGPGLSSLLSAVTRAGGNRDAPGRRPGGGIDVGGGEDGRSSSSAGAPRDAIGGGMRPPIGKLGGNLADGGPGLSSLLSAARDAIDDGSKRDAGGRRPGNSLQKKYNQTKQKNHNSIECFELTSLLTSDCRDASLASLRRRSRVERSMHRTTTNKNKNQKHTRGTTTYHNRRRDSVGVGRTTRQRRRRCCISIIKGYFFFVKKKSKRHQRTTHSTHRLLAAALLRLTTALRWRRAAAA